MLCRKPSPTANQRFEVHILFAVGVGFLQESRTKDERYSSSSPTAEPLQISFIFQHSTPLSSIKLLLTVDPEVPVPPEFYGGIERIIDFLIEEFIKSGLEVTLVAHRDSKWPNILRPWPGLRSGHPVDFIRNANHLIRVWGAHGPFNLIHSFSRLAYLIPFFGQEIPIIQSYQRPISPRSIQRSSLLSGSQLTYTACSRSLALTGRVGDEVWDSIPNGVRLNSYQFVEHPNPGAPLVFLGRMERVKGPHHAIRVAQATRRPLILAGNRATTGIENEYFLNEISPYLNETEIRYIGPVNDAQKNELLGNAAALLFPIEWEEPFGIVMAEALACGTPVLAFNRGAVPEVVVNGVTGWAVNTVAEMVACIGKVNQISRKKCREHIETHFSSEKIAAKYIELYHRRLDDFK